jgi:hypothetical protein
MSIRSIRAGQNEIGEQADKPISIAEQFTAKEPGVREEILALEQRPVEKLEPPLKLGPDDGDMLG